MSAHNIQSYGYFVGAGAVLVPALVLIVLAYLAGRGRRQRAVDLAYEVGKGTGWQQGYDAGHRAGWAAATDPTHPGGSARHASTEVLAAVQDDAARYINGVYGGGR